VRSQFIPRLEKLESRLISYFVSLVHYLYKQYRENSEVPLSFKKVTKLFTYGWKAVSAWRDTSTAEGRQACDQLEAVGKEAV